MYKSACCKKCDRSKDRWTPRCANAACECHKALASHPTTDNDKEKFRVNLAVLLEGFARGVGYAEGKNLEEEIMRLFRECKADLLLQERRRVLDEVAKTVEKARKYANWTHTRGNHADDFSDTEPCNCDAEEKKYKNDTYDAVLKRVSSLRSIQSECCEKCRGYQDPGGLCLKTANWCPCHLQTEKV